MDGADTLERLRLERDLYRGLLALDATGPLEPFLERALRLVVSLTGAHQGYLELAEPHGAGDDDRWFTAADCSEEEVEEIRQRVSRGVIAEALATGETIRSHSALLDPRFRDRRSVRQSGIHAVLCAPIGSDPPVGVLYLQRRTMEQEFTEEDQERAEIFARHLGPLAGQLLERRRRAAEQDPTQPLRARLKLEALVGSSPALAALMDQIAMVAPLHVGVLLTGETGTGKSLVARVIHENSARSGGPLVEVNCAALPENLMESELFGALPGAHSTATRRVEGKVPAARRGTLLLDEVAELSPAAQAKLLQLLQAGEYYPLGASRPEKADVRIIAATNVDLQEAVAQRRFREDLFYRLQVLPVRVPALAERREDIRALARFFCEAAHRTHGLRRLELSPGALHALEARVWPGNIRELQHAVDAAAIRAAVEPCGQVEARHFYSDPKGPSRAPADCTFQEGTRRYQQELLASTLEATGWNVTAAARRLDLTRAHVYNLIKAFGIRRQGEERG